jgi:hypothetical protein
MRVILVALCGLATACYTLQPAVGASAPLGTEMAFDINDAGRVALGGTMGPEIAQIEGRLIERDSSEYVVAVTGLKLLRGGEQVWRGERVHIKSAYVSSIYEKRYSRSKSVAMGAVGLGVLAAIVGRSIGGIGPPGDSGPSPGDTSHTSRIPRP